MVLLHGKGFGLSLLLALLTSASAHNGLVVKRDKKKKGLRDSQFHREMKYNHNDASIVSGTAVTSTTTYPFFVHWERIGCGGQLIHEDIVLTAAHCKSSNDGPSDETLYMLGLTQGTGLSLQTETQVAHPNYNDVTTENDFMIFKLRDSALVDGSGIATGAEVIALNTDSAVPVAGSNLKIMGYGTTSSGGVASDDLLEATVQAVSDATCNAADSYNGEIVGDVMLCAASTGIDTCQGDSGGPLVDVTTGKLVGVVSWGRGCADPIYPGVYAQGKKRNSVIL